MARLGRSQPNRPVIVRPRSAEPSGDLTLSGNPSLTLTGTSDRFGDLTLSGNPSLTISGIKQTGIGVPPRPRTRWQMVLGPAAGGHEVALTDAKTRRYVARLTQPSDMSFTIDGRTDQAAAITELQTDVHLLFSTEDTTVILDRCRVGQTADSINEDTHETTVTCLDYRAVLNRRHLYSTDTLTFTGLDQTEIAWALIDATQSRHAGDLGIHDGSMLTGITRDRTYEAGDSIGERIQELSEVMQGFDWDLLPLSASSLSFQVWYPQRGRNNGVVLILGGLVANVDRELNPSDYANAVRHTGGEGLMAAELEAGYLEIPGTYPEGRWDAVFGDDSLTTQSALDDRAAWQLAESQVVRPTYTVKLHRGAWKGPGHIWLGDTVRLIIPSGRLDVDTTGRVFEVQIDIDEQGGETVTLVLGGPEPDFTRWPPEVDRRLRKLERR